MIKNRFKKEIEEIVYELNMCGAVLTDLLQNLTIDCIEINKLIDKGFKIETLAHDMGNIIITLRKEKNLIPNIEQESL